MGDELPPLVTRLTGDISDLADSLVKGKALTQAYKAEVESGLSGGRAIGEKFGKDLGDGIQDAIPTSVGGGGDAGQRIGKQIGDGIGKGIQDALPEASGDGAQIGDRLVVGADGRLRDARGRFVATGQQLGQGLGDGLSTGIDPGLSDVDRKVKDQAGKTGKDAGKAAGDGMSPLIVGAIAGAVTIGGPLLVAGLGGAMVGATALILRQNQVISADFQQVGKDAATMVQSAAAPLTGELHAALAQMDAQVTGLAPEFKALFAGAEPDIAQVTSGLTGFASSLLPGVSQAVTSSQVIVKDFSQSLPQLGSNVGGFFSGLVHDANVQGQALNQTIGALGNTVRTAGSLIGDASAAASSDLLALTPVLNGLNTAIRAVASPATVGGIAGLFGAMKLDPKLQSGLSGAADSLDKVAAKAEQSGGVLGKLSGAASGASGILGKMAGVVGGPWGLAIGAGIGLASGLAAALMNADDATKAITVDQATLSDAVAKDGAHAGEATSAYIAAQAQLSGLADEAKSAGVPLDLLTQAALGNTKALGELETSTSHANEAQRQQQLVGSELLTGQDGLNTSMATGVNRLNESLVVTNSLTTTNQQLINSVKAQAQQTADAINKQTEYNAATMALNNSTNIFDATMSAEYQKLQQKAQVTGQNAAAALNLGTNQTALNMSLADSVNQYTMATSQAGGYQSVLAALNGTESTLLGSEAQFAIALAGVSQAAQANGHSLDQNDAKGAQNIVTFTGLATSAQKAAVAVYQSEVSTKGASVAYDDANTKLKQEKQAFIDAADKAGFQKDKVKELANELFQLPKDVPIDITADTQKAIALANGAVKYIDSLTGTITVQAQNGTGVSYNPGSGGKAYYDGGGWTRALPGHTEDAVLHPHEYVLSEDMLSGRQQIDPRVLASLRSAMAGVGVSGGAAGPSPGGSYGGASGPSGITVIAPIYLDGKQIGSATTKGARAEVQNFARHNALTGFADNYK